MASGRQLTEPQLLPAPAEMPPEGKKALGSALHQDMPLWKTFLSLSQQ